MRDIKVGKALCLSINKQTLTSNYGHSKGMRSCFKKISNLLAKISIVYGSWYSSGKRGKEIQCGKNWIDESWGLKLGTQIIVCKPNSW